MSARIFDEEEQHRTLSVKVPTNHKEALEALARGVGETPSAIVRRLLREELYYRGLIDDELL